MGWVEEIAELGRSADAGAFEESKAAAIGELEKDAVIREALGAQICERFISAKRLEWDDYRLEVTPWELKKYLTNY